MQDEERVVKGITEREDINKYKQKSLLVVVL